MPDLIWYCPQCQYGPLNPHIDAACPNCGWYPGKPSRRSHRCATTIENNTYDRAMGTSDISFCNAVVPQSLANPATISNGALSFGPTQGRPRQHRRY